MPMRKIIRACLIAALIFCAGCDGAVSVKGTVRGPDQQPIPDAHIVLEYGLHQTASDTNGAFQVGSICGPIGFKTEVFVSKTGYKPVTVPIDAARRFQCDVVLLPESATGKSRALVKRE